MKIRNLVFEGMTVSQNPPQLRSLIPGLADSALVRWCVYGLMAFPIVDYTLRTPWLHPLGLAWDKIVLGILFVYALVRYLSGYRLPPFRWYRYAAWFILYGLGLMFAGLSSPLVALQGYRIDVYYIVYTLLIPFVVTPRDVPKLLHIGAAVAILIAVSAVYQYILGVPNPPGWADVGEHIRTRVFTVLKSPNELGSYMALTTPLLVGMFLAEQDKWRRRLYLLGIPFAVATLLFTYTRAAWMSFALALLVVAVLFERRLLIGLVVLAVLVYFIPPIHHRIADLLSPVYWIKSAQAGRIYRWIVAYDQMASNPLLGVGVGRFGGAVASQYLGVIYSDNYYMKTLAETGLVGLTLFVTMHFAMLREVFVRSIRGIHGRQRYILIGGFTGLIAVLIHNSMENVFEYAPMVIAYFMYATLYLIWSGPHGLGNASDARGRKEATMDAAVEKSS